jgi:4-amino-4-deoxy-L-arabinose transferase-like glycosyltransferase
VLALAVRLAWVLYSHRVPVGLHDPVAYDALAKGIIDGKGFAQPAAFIPHAPSEPVPTVPTAYFPPGYPAVLAVVYAIFGHRVLWGEILNALLGAATVVITYELARRLLGHPVARVAGLLLAFWPNQVFYTGALLSEILFTFLLMSGLLVLLADPWPKDGINLKRLAFAALFLGAATMVRPIVLIVPVVLLVYWLRVFPNRTRVLAQVGVILLVFAAIIVPWSVRNAVSMHAFVPISTNGGDDFCVGNHEGATGSFVFAGLCYEGYDDISNRTEKEIEAYREGIRRGAEFIVNHPADEFGLIFEKAYFLVYRDDEGLYANESYGDNLFIEKEMRDYLSTAANAYYFVTVGWAALGLLLWSRRRDPRRTFFLMMLGCLLVVPLAFFGDVRFHFPAVPLLCILAATAVMMVWRGRGLPPQPGEPDAA